MNISKKNIPEGTKDIIFNECKIKRKVESSLRTLFENNGYEEIITPTMEFYDVFAQNKVFASEDMYKLVDLKNRILVLRPDCTTPIARVVATRLKGYQMPLKLYYNQNVFRVNDTLGGKRDEITQCGAELIGANDLQSDVDILKTAIGSLKECFGESFKIEVGHIGLFDAVADECGLTETDKERLRKLIEQKSYAALSTFFEKYPKCEKLKAVISLFGSISILETAKAQLQSNSAAEILSYLESLMVELEKENLSKYIMLDLGLTQHIDYYTSIIFRGYIEGSGQIVLSGGRYDNLIAKFGADLPATGFAINIDTVTDTLLKENKSNEGF